MTKTLFDRQIQFHQTALNLQAHRQQLIASNIANADTPHYKARDVDFRAALQGALNASREGVQMATTQAGHIGRAPAPALESLTGYRSELQSAVGRQHGEHGRRARRLRRERVVDAAQLFGIWYRCILAVDRAVVIACQKLGLTLSFC